LKQILSFEMNKPPSGGITFSMFGVMVASAAAGFCGELSSCVSNIYSTDASEPEGKRYLYTHQIFKNSKELIYAIFPLVLWRRIGGWIAVCKCHFIFVSWDFFLVNPL